MDAADGFDPCAAADAAWEQRRQQGAGADEEQRTQSNGHEGERRGTKRQFPLIRFGDIKLNGQRRYIVKNLIPLGGLIVVWGPPKCGKSFWVSDLVLHVALGRAYRDRRVDPGVVVYITCEGQSGFPARIEAFRSRKLQGDDQEPSFYLLPAPLDLVGDINALIAEIAAQLGTTAPILIVVDTLNRSLAGSESRDEDMSAYVRACDQLREAFECAVIVIHHCGVDGNRPRGHTSLTGAADAQIAIKRDDGDRIIAKVEHMKDGAEGDVIASRLAVVEIGLDEDGDILTSCVIEPAEAPTATKAKAGKGLTAAARVALNTLRKAVAEAGEPPPAGNHIPTQARVVPVETWRRYHYTGTASDGQSTETRKKDFQRVRNQLQAAGEIGLHADLCWVVADA